MYAWTLCYVIVSCALCDVMLYHVIWYLCVLYCTIVFYLVQKVRVNLPQSAICCYTKTSVPRVNNWTRQNLSLIGMFWWLLHSLELLLHQFSCLKQTPPSNTSCTVSMLNSWVGMVQRTKARITSQRAVILAEITHSVIVWLLDCTIQLDLLLSCTDSTIVCAELLEVQCTLSDEV